mmetsp:Transcript_75564/g.161942  ORF Transcript_75564/g.161942 Transcript_75564/m.161942 type:complete len:201 (-) Transcript_75564:242-844(-)
MPRSTSERTLSIACRTSAWLPAHSDNNASTLLPRLRVSSAKALLTSRTCFSEAAANFRIICRASSISRRNAVSPTSRARCSRCSSAAKASRRSATACSACSRRPRSPRSSLVSSTSRRAACSTSCRNCRTSPRRPWEPPRSRAISSRKKPLWSWRNCPMRCSNSAMAASLGATRRVCRCCTKDLSSSSVATSVSTSSSTR